MTLPHDVHPIDNAGKTIEIKDLIATSPVRIQLPLRANSIGIIDGQHRLYSYHESRIDDPKIAQLRKQQNLLVTGIIYPQNIPNSERERFEATQFLAINSTQTNASTPLKQEIEVFLNPSSPIAIGRQVLQYLSKKGPLAGHVQKYFFDKDKLKTSSIVSFGLGSLIKLTGDDSLFCLFDHPEKENLEKGRSNNALDAYIEFCASTINLFLGAVRANVDDIRWTSSKTIDNRLLTVTSVISFLITLRILIRNKESITFSDLKNKLKNIETFNFSSYHSSQYARMAEKIYEVYFQQNLSSNPDNASHEHAESYELSNH